MTSDTAHDAAALMATGGDGRIRLDPATGLNRYFSAPRPRDVLAYASSTANDISPAAYDAAVRVLDAIVSAPSGTDLEYVALACMKGRGDAGTNAVLLGADEVGSGCIQSAHGLYF